MLKLVKSNKIIKSTIIRNKLYKKHSQIDPINIESSIIGDEVLAKKFSDLLLEVFTLINKFYQI